MKYNAFFVLFIGLMLIFGGMFSKKVKAEHRKLWIISGVMGMITAIALFFSE